MSSQASKGKQSHDLGNGLFVVTNSFRLATEGFSVLTSKPRRLGFALLLSILCTPIVVGEASACMCAEPRTPAQISAAVEDYMSAFDYVFAGVVVGAKTELREGLVGPPGEQSEWTKYDIWVLEVGKGHLNGTVSVVRPNIVGAPIWLVGGYAEVLAAKRDGELQADWGLCDCGRGHVFALNGPVPPWKALLIYGAGLLAILAIGIAIWIFARKSARK
jgi:hypothetical protein